MNIKPLYECYGTHSFTRFLITALNAGLCINLINNPAHPPCFILNVTRAKFNKNKFSPHKKVEYALEEFNNVNDDILS